MTKFTRQLLQPCSISCIIHAGRETAQNIPVYRCIVTIMRLKIMLFLTLYELSRVIGACSCSLRSASVRQRLLGEQLGPVPQGYVRNKAMQRCPPPRGALAQVQFHLVVAHLGSATTHSKRLQVSRAVYYQTLLCWFLNHYRM